MNEQEKTISDYTFQLEEAVKKVNQSSQIFQSYSTCLIFFQLRFHIFRDVI